MAEGLLWEQAVGRSSRFTQTSSSMVYGFCILLIKAKLVPDGDNNKVGTNLITYEMTSNIKLNNRNAFEIINALRNYDNSVLIEKTSENRRANAKSLLGLLSLGIEVGDEINIIISNTNDEVKTLLDDIERVFENK